VLAIVPIIYLISKITEVSTALRFIELGNIRETPNVQIEQLSVLPLNALTGGMRHEKSTNYLEW
jgi:hypothetical protein